MDAATLAGRTADAAQYRALGCIMNRLAGNAGGGTTAPAGAELEYRSLRLEISARFLLSEYQAARLMDTAHHAHDLYRATLEALESGGISTPNLHVVVDEGLVFCSLAPEAATARRAQYEALVLPHAHVETPNRLRPIARRIAVELADLPVEEQHAEAKTRRCVQVHDRDHGMAELVAFVPAAAAYAMKDRVRQVAKSILNAEHAAAKAEPASPVSTTSPGPASPRKLAEVEADALVDLLLAGEVPVTGDHAVPQGRKIRAQVQVIVPGHVLGLGGGPLGNTARSTARSTATEPGARVADVAHGGDAAYGGDAACGGDAAVNRAAAGPRVGGTPELIGYGPISDATARQLAADSDVWELVAVNYGGTVLRVERYRPTPEMTRFITARDLHCRAPGCRAPARRSDIDHTIDAAWGGATSTDNLAVLCRGHHVLKHHSNWRLEQHGGGVLTWTSPGGIEHVSQPPSRVRFQAVLPEPGGSSAAVPTRAPGTESARALGTEAARALGTESARAPGADSAPEPAQRPGAAARTQRVAASWVAELARAAIEQQDDSVDVF